MQCDFCPHPHPGHAKSPMLPQVTAAAVFQLIGHSLRVLTLTAERGCRRPPTSPCCPVDGVTKAWLNGTPRTEGLPFIFVG
jgi:hypothetical protein